MKKPGKMPELNLSKLRSGDLKAPKPIRDLYRELKGQHLLPIVGLLIAGLIAVPLLLGGSADHNPSSAVAAQAPIRKEAKEASLSVSKWTPGILDYKRNLRGAKAIDPFKAKDASGGESSGSGSEVEAAPAPSKIEAVESPVESLGSELQELTELPETSPTPAHSDSGEQGGETKAGSSEGEKSGPETIDVQVTTVHQQGGVDRSPVRRDLTQLTKLPSEATPAFTYVGPSEDGAKAMMAVSSEVTAMIGDSNCVVPAKPCSLLALEVGAPQTVVYGKDGLTYRIELVRIGDHSNAPGKADRNHPAPGHDDGAGAEPSPRSADAMIGVGALRVVERVRGF